MKFVLLSFILVLMGCGKGNLVITVPEVEKASANYQEPNKLSIDPQTITDEVEIVSANGPTAFIKDISKVHILPSHDYIQRGNILYKISIIDKVGVKLINSKIVHDTSDSAGHYIGNVGFKLEAIDLTTKKIVNSKIIDNLANEDSELPTNNGSHWFIEKFDLNIQLPLITLRKFTLQTKCPGTKTLCSSGTDEYAIASLDLNLGTLNFIKLINGKTYKAYYNNNSIYYYNIINNNLVINKLNILDKVETQQTVALHANHKDFLTNIYFHKDNFYIAGRWKKTASTYLLELMKFDLDLEKEPSIAYDNATSGLEGNIDVIGDDELVIRIRKVSSMNDDLVFNTSEYSLKEKERYYDIYLIDSRNGDLAEYFNKKSPLKRKAITTELFYNDDNHIYFLKWDKESLILDSVNKGGVTSLINGAQSAKINFKRTFVTPIIEFFEVHNGIATIVIWDEGKHYIKRFNIH
jgi:hypothetical protein